MKSVHKPKEEKPPEKEEPAPEAAVFVKAPRIHWDCLLVKPTKWTCPCCLESTSTILFSQSYLQLTTTCQADTWSGCFTLKPASPISIQCSLQTRETLKIQGWMALERTISRVFALWWFHIAPSFTLTGRCAWASRRWHVWQGRVTRAPGALGGGIPLDWKMTGADGPVFEPWSHSASAKGGVASLWITYPLVRWLCLKKLAYSNVQFAWILFLSRCQVGGAWTSAGQWF